MDDSVATKADLKELEDRLVARMDAGFAAQEERLERRMDARFAAQEQRFEGRMDTWEQRIIDRVGTMIRDTETRLLAAFYTYAQVTDKRLVQTEANVSIFFDRLGKVEGRLLEVEKRLNTPPLG